jgi:hypothetical protein
MALDLGWFNISYGPCRVGRFLFWPWVAFNRRSTDGHWWGVGLLQVNDRHLLYLGHTGIDVFWVGLMRKVRR